MRITTFVIRIFAVSAVFIALAVLSKVACGQTTTIRPVYFDTEGGVTFLNLDSRTLRDDPAVVVPNDYRLCGDNSWDNCWGPLEWVASRRVLRLAVTSSFLRANAKMLDRPIWITGRRTVVDNATGAGWMDPGYFVSLREQGANVDVSGIARKGSDGSYFYGVVLGSNGVHSVNNGCTTGPGITFDPWYTKTINGVESWVFKNQILSGILEASPPTELFVVGSTVGWARREYLQAVYQPAEGGWVLPATPFLKDKLGRDVTHPIQLVSGEIGPSGDWAEFDLFARTPRGFNIPEARLRQIGLAREPNGTTSTKLLIFVDSRDNGIYFGKAPGNVSYDTPFSYSTLSLESHICGALVSTAVEESDLPAGYALDQNYPNPFNPTTTIGYDLPTTQQVRLTVHDVLGRQVAVLVDGMEPSGHHEASFGASDLPSGTYVYRITAGNAVATRRMVLAK